MKHTLLIIIVTLGLWLWGCNAKSKSTSSPQPERKIALAPRAEKARQTTTNFGVLVSIDGLGALYLKPMREKGHLPGLTRLAGLGAHTDDARTDPDNTTTLPNHTCMITGLPVARPVSGSNAFHGLTFNRDPWPRMTLHNSGNPRLTYVPSIFDVAHDFGKKTCMFSGKSRFVLYERSYDETHGAADHINPDHGRDKIDVAVISMSSEELFDRFSDIMMSEKPCHLTFFHIAEPDRVGHQHGWGGDEWQKAVMAADEVVSKILGILTSDARFKDHSALIVTADHGGHGNQHSDTRLEANFTIPFYVMAPGISRDAQLYQVFSKTRHRWPGHNPSLSVSPQPIRNGDAGNLLLELLGLPPVPGSVMFGMMQ